MAPFNRTSLNRATQQLETLNREVEAFVKTEPYTLVTNFDASTKENVVRIKSHKRPPDAITGLVNDIIGGLREALDHLAYALATKAAPLPNPWESAFPIVLDPMKWRDSGVPDIRHVEPAAQALIERFQPYHRVPPQSDPLALLDALNNAKKHRVPHEIQTVSRRAEYVVETPTQGFVSVRTSTALPGGFPNQAEIGRIRLPRGTPDTTVHMRFRVPCEVCFDQSTLDGAPVRETLTTIQTRVWTITGRLAGQFLK